MIQLSMTSQQVKKSQNRIAQIKFQQERARSPSNWKIYKQASTISELLSLKELIRNTKGRSRKRRRKQSGVHSPKIQNNNRSRNNQGSLNSPNPAQR